MNTIFHKTLIATALSAILSTSAMAEENYEDTIDGGTNEEKQLNQQNKSGHDTMPGNRQGMKDGNTPYDNNDDNLTYDSDRDDSENRNQSEHQDSVLGEQDATDNKNASDRDMSTQARDDNSSYRNNTDNMSSKTTGLYSMSADELVGMKVVDSNGDEIGDVTGVVLSADQEDAHAVINLGGMLGIGGRDVLTSFDKLTMENEQLRLNANQNEIDSMTDYGSENHTELEGDTSISEQLRIQ